MKPRLIVMQSIVGYRIEDCSNELAITRIVGTAYRKEYADLFAAAPDMLTALEWILAHECQTTPCMECAIKAKEAITKVVGE